MARFIQKEQNTPLKYNPLSYDEINRIPMLLQAREEEMLNNANSRLDSYAMIRVPEDEGARKVYNEYGEKLKSQVSDISERLLRNGSIDPMAMSGLQSLKRNYTDTTGVNGFIGKLAENRATIDAQRAAQEISHTAQGNRPELFNDIFQNQLTEYNKGINYDELVNNPNYSFKTFQGQAAPKMETVENMLARMDKSLGSISTSTSSQTVASKRSDGGYQLTYADDAQSNSSNNKALQAATETMMLEINDPNSELMTSLKYNNPGKTIEELQYEAAQELSSRVSSRIRSTSQTATATDVKFVADQDDPTLGGSGRGSNGNANTDKSSDAVTLAYQDTNYESTEAFKDTAELKNIYNGKVEAELEVLERVLSNRTDTNSQSYKETEKLIINKKAELASIKFKVSEDMMNDPTYFKTYANNFKNRNKKFDNADKARKSLYYDYKFRSGSTLESFLNSEQGIKNLYKSSDVYKKYLESNPMYAQANILLEGAGAKIYPGNISILMTPVNGRVERVGPNASAFANNNTTKNKSYYEGKEGIKKYLRNNNINMSDAEFNTFYKTVIDKRIMDYGIESVNNGFIDSKYGEGKGEVGISSNRIVIPNAEAKDKYDKDITAMGGLTIVNEFKGNDNNVFYEPGNSESFIKAIDAKDDSDLSQFLLDVSQEGKFEFDSIIERGPGKSATIMLRASVGTGDKAQSKLMGIDIHGKNTAQGTSTNTVLIDKLIALTSGTDQARLIAIRDNAKYDNIYVDTPEVGSAGLSKHQSNQIKTYIQGSRAGNDKNYKALSPLSTSSKSNIVAHNNGYHSFNYVDSNNNPKTLTMGQFFLKDKMYDDINSNTISQTGIYNESEIAGLNFTNTGDNRAVMKAVSFVQSIQNLGQLLERIDDQGKRTSGVIRIEDDAVTRKVMEQFESMKDPSIMNDPNQLLNVAKGIYSTIKNVPLMHRNKLKGI